MKFLINFFGYEGVWFAAVIGAGAGLWWPGAVAALVFALVHAALFGRDRGQLGADLRLLAVAVGLGILLDGALAYSGLVRYAAAEVALPPGGAPLWILTMWAAFALTLRHSLGVLARVPPLAFAVGAVFGPLAYLGAARGWNAAVLSQPQWQPLLALALGWGASMWLLAKLAARWPTGPTAPVTAASENVR